jgi:hypothetical protein
VRVYTAVAASIGWFALLLQLFLEIHRSLAGGLPMAAIIVGYFSFFTILTNLLVAAVLTSSGRHRDSKLGSFFSRPTVQTATVTYIAIVGITYSLLLRKLWNPIGLQKLADVLLHDAMPVIYILFWLIWVPKGNLRWKDCFVWLAYPLLYLLYILTRGAITGLYPYPFIDVASLGYPRMFGNVVLFLIFFLAVGLVAVAVGRWTGRRKLAES